MEPDPRTAAGAHRLRPLNEPVRLRRTEVETGAGGAPRAVVLRGRRHTVASVDETWRVDDEWWRSTAGGPLSRQYFRLVLEDGRAVTVYRDLVEGGWWMQRY